MPSTTIQIDLEVREELRALGRMGESYNDVIKRLLAAARHLEAFRPGARPVAERTGGPLWIPMRDKR